LLAWAGIVTLALAFGLSWASHPASRGWLSLVADYLHLVAGAVWVGGLVGLALLARAMRGLDRHVREEVFRVCVLRFSALAGPAVVVVVLAGTFLALRALPAPSSLFDTSYGVTLLIKCLIVLGALALGAYHRRSVVPRLTAGAPLATLRRTLGFELGFLLTALALAATLSQTAPPA
jgi:copper transport protein